MKNYPTPELPLVSDARVIAVSASRGEFPGMKSSDRAPHEEIMHRAYAIWEREGHPGNRQLEHWLAAEVEIMSRR